MLWASLLLKVEVSDRADGRRCGWSMRPARGEKTRFGAGRPPATRGGFTLAPEAFWHGSHVPKNRSSRKADRGPEWAIAIRYPDGGFAYFFEDGSMDRYGKPLERWGRESQARRFESEHEANQIVLAWLRSEPSPPVTYEVVHLRPRS